VVLDNSPVKCLIWVNDAAPSASDPFSPWEERRFSVFGFCPCPPGLGLFPWGFLMDDVKVPEA
tara:strand:+ start:1837 stop:2025 length:189 start_codon:yes stop_codon:yes gene_type:complete